MIGLDFVKKIDKDWKKHIKLENEFNNCIIKCPICGIKLSKSNLFNISDRK